MKVKKQWQKPELIVLVRSNPEEAVLLACKGGISDSANNSDGGCMGIDMACNNCLSTTPS